MYDLRLDENMMLNWGKVFDDIGVILFGDFDWKSEFLLELEFGNFPFNIWFDFKWNYKIILDYI